MFTLFWDPGGPILGLWEGKGETVNSEGYCAVVTRQLKQVVPQEAKMLVVANPNFAARKYPSA
jgi:hypothetical protein